ncbi:MAG: YdeI/OmpD-associated family protein [Bacteroidota bacterium]
MIQTFIYNQENALLKKLQLKAGFKVLLINAPGQDASILGETADLTFVNDQGNFNALIIFIQNSLELKEALLNWSAQITLDKIVWMAYPKKSSGIPSDLKMEKWTELEEYQLTPCASASINETWTGIRIKPITAVKRSGVGNAQIKTNEFADFIDVENKVVTPPADLAKLFLQHPEAGNFFNTLAYSHKKEYVLWIVTAKQEATRNNRLQKTIEMLLLKKKNPTEK